MKITEIITNYVVPIAFMVGAALMILRGKLIWKLLRIAILLIGLALIKVYLL